MDDAVPRADRREDPRAKAMFLSLREREPADPAGIELELLSGLAIEHRDRRRRFPKLQLEETRLA
jgi:TorA maturation chaperone TorD